MTPPDPVFLITLDGLLKAWQFVGVPLFGAVCYYVRDIGRQLKQLNGQVRETKIWMKEHEKADNCRFEGTQRELDQIQRRCEQALRSGTPGHGGMGDQ